MLPAIFAGGVTIVNVKVLTSSLSTSVAVKVVVIVSPSLPEPFTSAATGCSFTS